MIADLEILYPASDGDDFASEFVPNDETGPWPLIVSPVDCATLAYARYGRRDSEEPRTEHTMKITPAQAYTSKIVHGGRYPHWLL